MHQLRAAFAVLIAFFASALHAESLIDVAGRFDARTAGESRAVPDGTVIKQGNAEFSLISGTAAPVLAGTEQIGVFFQGQGRYTYRITDRDELVVATGNAKRLSKLGTPGDGVTVVSDTFTRAFFWIAGAPMPKLGDASTSALSAAFKEHQAAFADDLSQHAVHQFVLQRFNAPSQPVVRAELIGGKEQVVYVYDGANLHEESLYALRRGTYRITKNFLYPSVISSHPIDRTLRKVPAPRYTLTAIDYTLVATKENDAKLTMTETYAGGRAGISVLSLKLYNSFFDQNEKTRYMHVRSVKDANGKDLPFDHRKDEIVVQLPAALPPNAAAKITFEIDGDFLVHPNSDNFWQLGVEEWFPQPSVWVEHSYTIHSTVKVQKPYLAFAPGKTVRRAEEGEYNVVENTIDKPVQFAVVHAGKYSVEEETRKGVTVRVATYAGKNTRAMKQLTNLSFSIIELYEYFLGPFPFPEFNIIEINLLGYGQAPPATMFITAEAFNPIQDANNRIYSGGINERFAHEIAHQYWGTVVKMPTSEEQWITESFAEYCAALFLKMAKKDGSYEIAIRDWQRDAAEASKFATIATANRIETPDDWQTGFFARTSLMYDKGAYLLATLHKELGDDAFLTFLKSYQTSFRWKFGSSDTVAGLLKFMTKKDYAPLFEETFWGTKMPAMPK
jgi:hypothetical protein